MKNLVMLVVSLALVSSTLAAQEPTIKSLVSKELTGRPDKELLMITVEYPPGGFDPVHRHHAQAMVYVLEGAVVMQVEGKPPSTLGPGDTFYEGPDDVHLVARNASDSAPAKFLVFFVKDKGTPVKLSAK